MAVRIRSLLVTGPTTIPLNSGASVRLSPGEVSAELPDVEVTGNAKVDRLRRAGVVEVESTDAPPSEDSADAGQAAADSGRTRSRKSGGKPSQAT